MIRAEYKYIELYTTRNEDQIIILDALPSYVEDISEHDKSTFVLKSDG